MFYRKEDTSTVPTQEVVEDLLSIFNNLEPRTETQQQQQQRQQRPIPSSRSQKGTRKAKDTPSSSTTEHRTAQKKDMTQKARQSKLCEARKSATRQFGTFDYDAAYNVTPNSGSRKRKRPLTSSHSAGAEENPVNLDLPVNTEEALSNLPNHTGTVFSQGSACSTDVLNPASPAHSPTRSDSATSQDSDESKPWRSE